MIPPPNEKTRIRLLLLTRGVSRHFAKIRLFAGEITKKIVINGVHGLEEALQGVQQVKKIPRGKS